MDMAGMPKSRIPPCTHAHTHTLKLALADTHTHTLSLYKQTYKQTNNQTHSLYMIPKTYASTGSDSYGVEPKNVALGHGSLRVASGIMQYTRLLSHANAHILSLQLTHSLALMHRYRPLAALPCARASPPCQKGEQDGRRAGWPAGWMAGW